MGVVSLHRIWKKNDIETSRQQTLRSCLTEQTTENGSPFFITPYLRRVDEKTAHSTQRRLCDKKKKRRIYLYEAKELTKLLYPFPYY